MVLAVAVVLARHWLPSHAVEQAAVVVHVRE